MRSAAYVVAALGFVSGALSPGNGHSAPSIEELVGSLSAGEEVTIRGNGFGAVGPSIALYDDFSGGVSGGPLDLVGGPVVGSWTKFNTTPTLYDAQEAHSAPLSMRVKDSSSLTTAIVRLNFEPATEFFLSYWFRTETSGTNMQAGQWKLAWIMDGDRGWGAPGLDIVLPGVQGGDWFGISSNDTVHWDLQIPNFVPANEWIRFQIWAQDRGSNPMGYFVQTMGNTFGQWSRDDITTVSQWNNKSGYTFFGGNQSTSVNWLNFPGYINQAGAAWYDDIYLATGPGAQARVELTDSSDYESSRSAVLLLVTAWSDTEILVRIPNAIPAGFDITQAAVHVFDEQGEHGVASPDRPSPPRSLEAL